MEFGSDCVYLYDEPEFEVISDEEYEQGMVVSDSDSDSDENDADGVKMGGAGGSKKSAKRGKLRKPHAPPPPPPDAPSAPQTATAASKPFQFKKTNTPRKWREREVGGVKLEKGKRERRADTNIISVNFQTLIAPSNMHTGDPIQCSSCDAVMSCSSKITTEGENKRWVCEFCGTPNIIDVEDEEIPKTKDVTFMLEPALSTTASGPTGMDESLVIFCVDVSGSMCVTTEVPGRINFRGSAHLNRLQSLNTDRSDQYLPSQRRNVTYVSRLQAVQAAVDHQLQEMVTQHPNRRVALIAFNNEVCVFGDGSDTPITIAGNKLTDSAELEKIGSEVPLPKAVKDSRKVLGDKLFCLEEGGATALGPALMVATTMAAQNLGSKVIICTDGKANIGLGRLDLEGDDAEKDAEFYENVGSIAACKGVSVSVISIKGTDCKLAHLGKLADASGGQVNIVDPLKLTQEFSTILADSIIATNVVATCIIDKGLFFHYEETESNKVVRRVGNVTSSTEITFEYGVKCKKDSKQKDKKKCSIIKEQDDVPDAQPTQPETESPAQAAVGPAPGSVPVEEKKELPFQLQIKYTDKEGAVAMRVLTESKPVTRDREEAERKMNLDVLGKHTAQTTAGLALDGKYTMSRGRALMQQRLAWRYTNTHDEGMEHRGKYKKMFNKIKSVENYMNEKQRDERSSHGTTYSDDEDEAVDTANIFLAAAPPSSSTKSAPSKIFNLFGGKKTKKAVKRSSECSDSTAKILFNMRKGSSYLDESD